MTDIIHSFVIPIITMVATFATYVRSQLAPFSAICS